MIRIHRPARCRHCGGQGFTFDPQDQEDVCLTCGDRAHRGPKPKPLPWVHGRELIHGGW